MNGTGIVQHLRPNPPQTVKLMEYADFEEEGREYLLRLATRADAEAMKYAGLVAAGRNSRGRSEKKRKDAEDRAARLRARAVDTSRHVWLIDITGWGHIEWVGTEASAYGWRMAKAQYERAPSSRVTKLSAARDDEPNGEVEYEPESVAAA